jgi:ribosomal protein S18 acetylase RimI-like enzyme
MDYKIREYQESDREILQTLIEKLMDYVVSVDPIKRIRRMPGYGPHYLKKTLKKYHHNQGKIYLVEYEENIIGYIFGFVADKQSKVNLLEVIPTQLGIIDDLYIDEKYRSKGIGTFLMDKMEKYLKDQGCDSLWLEVFAPNVNAHKYYRKLGFMDREIGMLKKIK